ncbi:hypothetical protein V2I01_26920 [Micromonospora sp. BRA006-A]|nr:hypothetical protein [Micromonospora sp. BRA006-A]
MTATDPTGGARQTSTSYNYVGAAWRYDDNEVVKAKYRTYGQFRGTARSRPATATGSTTHRRCPSRPTTAACPRTTTAP